MSKELNEAIERARWLLSNVKHAAMATVNDDGSPHNTPYFFICSPDLRELYWCSHPESTHSLNIKRSGQIFVVLYEADQGGGLYIKCDNARVASGAELERALTFNNLRLAKFGRSPVPISDYLEPFEQRMFFAESQTFWVNLSEIYPSGSIRKDYRIEIEREQLL